MVDLLKTKPVVDSEIGAQASSMTLIERYSLSASVQQQIGRVVMDKFTYSFVMSDQPGGPQRPIDVDD